MTRTLSIHVSSDVQSGDVILGDTLHPDSLPNARAGTVPNVAAKLRLLANRDTVGLLIGRIVNKDKPKELQS